MPAADNDQIEISVPNNAPPDHIPKAVEHHDVNKTHVHKVNLTVMTFLELT